MMPTCGNMVGMWEVAKLQYTRTAQGHREFAVNGRPFRAFWQQLGHRWVVYPAQPEAAGTGWPWEERRYFGNWCAVETWVRQSALLGREAQQG